MQNFDPKASKTKATFTFNIKYGFVNVSGFEIMVNHACFSKQPAGRRSQPFIIFPRRTSTIKQVKESYIRHVYGLRLSLSRFPCLLSRSRLSFINPCCSCGWGTDQPALRRWWEQNRSKRDVRHQTVRRAAQHLRVLLSRTPEGKMWSEEQTGLFNTNNNRFFAMTLRVKWGLWLGDIDKLSVRKKIEMSHLSFQNRSQQYHKALLRFHEISKSAIKPAISMWTFLIKFFRDEITYAVHDFIALNLYSSSLICFYSLDFRRNV